MSAMNVYYTCVKMAFEIRNTYIIINTYGPIIWLRLNVYHNLMTNVTVKKLKSVWLEHNKLMDVTRGPSSD